MSIYLFLKVAGITSAAICSTMVNLSKLQEVEPEYKGPVHMIVTVQRNIKLNSYFTSLSIYETSKKNGGGAEEGPHKRRWMVRLHVTTYDSLCLQIHNDAYQWHHLHHLRSQS